MKLQRNVPVVMRDGTRLMANVFHPDREPAPVVMSVTPYGKDATPDWLVMTLMRLSGVRFGKLDCSRWTGFEAPDPAFWTAAGYTVVQADVRGMHKSEGNAGVLTDRDADDYCDLIAWAAAEPWSTGAVGLAGVSYLAMSQWRAAARRPPALKAIVPWEGVTDLLREFAYQDGIPETSFIRVWWNNRMVRGRNKRYPMAEDFLAERDRHPLDDEFWVQKRPVLEAIDVPALVCASWSDHGLHTRGSLEGFERIGSQNKWLYTHGRRKWETFYSSDARMLQRRFFDHFLKGEANNWEATPRVRLEVRRSRDSFTVRPETAWPPPGVTYRPLHLDARTGRMTVEPPEQSGVAHYPAGGGLAGNRATFTYRFENDTELTGGMALRLFMSTSEGDDLDVFVVVRKFDAAGREVHFYGFNGFDRDVVAKGWLRASHRELDPARSRPGRPWHTHAHPQPVAADAIVPLDIEILSSSTLFEAGTSLRLDILGRDAARYPAFSHSRTVNRGTHSVHTGPEHASYLLAPFV